MWITSSYLGSGTWADILVLQRRTELFILGAIDWRLEASCHIGGDMLVTWTFFSIFLGVSLAGVAGG
jgi:hypothetical protein